MQMYDNSIPVENPKDIARPMFSMRPIQDETASKAEGRAIFKEAEWITILIPGDKTLTYEGPLENRHKQRWPDRYKAWKSGQDEPLNGTPLSEWTLLPRSRAEELQAMGIRTVEALTELSDANIPRNSGLQEIKQKARNWLEKSKDNSVLTRLQAKAEDTEKQNALLAKQNADMSEAVKKLQAQVEALQGKKEK